MSIDWSGSAGVRGFNQSQYRVRWCYMLILKYVLKGSREKLRIGMNYEMQLEKASLIPLTLGTRKNTKLKDKKYLLV